MPITSTKYFDYKLLLRQNDVGHVDSCCKAMCTGSLRYCPYYTRMFGRLVRLGNVLGPYALQALGLLLCIDTVVGGGSNIVIVGYNDLYMYCRGCKIIIKW